MTNWWGCLCTKFAVSSFTLYKIKEGSKNLKIRPKIPTTPLLGYFVIHEMENSKIYPYTKFEVSSYTRSKFREFKILAPRRPWPYFGGILSSMRWDMPYSIRISNLKCLAVPIPNLAREGVPKFKILAPDSHDPTLRVFCHPWDGTYLILSVYQIWSL